MARLNGVLLFVGVLILCGLLDFVGALKCQVCNNEECTTQRGYKTEDCSQGARFCYKLASERGQVYRSGCAYTDCSRIQMKPRSTCDVCELDNCNGLVGATEEQHEENPTKDDSLESGEDNSHLVRGRNQQHGLAENAAMGLIVHWSLAFGIVFRLVFV